MDYSNLKGEKSLRILATASGKEKQQLILNQLKRLLPEGSRLIVSGNKRAEYVLGGLSRMRKRKGVAEELLKNGKYFGHTSELIIDQNPDCDLFMGIDHIQRRAEKFTWKHHRLVKLSDTKHYYHIVFDILAELIDREQINFVLHFNCPHLFFDTIIYQIARSKGIATLMLTHSIFTGKFYSLKSIHHYGLFPVNVIDNSVEQFHIDSTETPVWDYMKSIKQYRG